MSDDTSGAGERVISVTRQRRNDARLRPLHQDIQDVLVELGLQPGDPVPSEATLVELLGVSRGSLREALKSLQALEIIETRHGTGMFVGRLSLSALVDGLVFHSKLGDRRNRLSTVIDLADVREILETQLIRRVAERATSADLVHFDSLLHAIQSVSGGVEQMDEADHAFHAGLYSNLGNEFVLSLLEAFWRVLRIVRPALLDNSGDRDENNRKHAAIVEALHSGDADEAESAMRKHFSGTRKWIESAGVTSASE